jgi:2-methylcitrate dehydratase PrpD
MGATEKIAKFIVDLDFSKVPAKGVEQIKISILDTLGTALVGARQPIGTMMTDFVTEMGGNPQARLIGSGMRTSVLNAAMANGTFAHAEDYDTVPHCGVIILPAALALGEHLRLPGKKIVEAYAVAYEVGSKMRALGDVTGAGFHSTSLFYTMASAAESAKLLGLDVAQTRATLGIAASMASGIMQNFGTYTKPLHAGHASRCGVLAASLAKKGFTGDPDVLEAPRGFFYVFGQQQADVRQVAENLGNPLAIAQTRLIVKPWPSCLANHPALTAMLPLIEENNIKPEQVSAVEVVQAAKPPGALIRTLPKSGYEGKFSLRYHLATALVDRNVDVSSFKDEKLARPIIQDLMKKVTVVQDPELTGIPLRLQRGPLEDEAVTVTVRLTDGRVLSRHVEHGADLKEEEIYAKYRKNATVGGMAASKIERTIELVKGFEDLKDITELMDTVS